jgi:hypothetical protein
MTNMLVCPSHPKFRSTFLTAPNIVALAATQEIFPVHTTHNASDGGFEFARMFDNSERGIKWGERKKIIIRARFLE